MPKSTLWRPPDDDLADDMEAARFVTGRSKNEIITAALRAYLADPKNVDPKALAAARRSLPRLRGEGPR